VESVRRQDHAPIQNVSARSDAKPVSTFADRALARKEGVDDSSLCEAIRRAANGLVDADVGKFLIKQRVARKNEGRSGGFRTIIFYQQGDRAVFLHLFAKSDKGNLTKAEAAAYRDFAKELATIKAERIKVLVDLKKWIEIDDENDQEKIS
jgi:hypothetical protein